MSLFIQTSAGAFTLHCPKLFYWLRLRETMRKAKRSRNWFKSSTLLESISLLSSASYCYLVIDIGFEGNKYFDDDEQAEFEIKNLRDFFQRAYVRTDFFSGYKINKTHNAAFPELSKKEGRKCIFPLLIFPCLKIALIKRFDKHFDKIIDSCVGGCW